MSCDPWGFRKLSPARGHDVIFDYLSLQGNQTTEHFTLVREPVMSRKSKNIWIVPLIKAPPISMKHMDIGLNQCIHLCVCVQACVHEWTCVWCCEFGVTSYILLHEPVLKGADKSCGVDVWSAEWRGAGSRAWGPSGTLSSSAGSLHSRPSTTPSDTLRLC